MTGRAQSTLEAPVIQGTRGILALPKEVAQSFEAGPCIRCHRCIEACPVFVSPVRITLASERHIFEKEYIGEVEQCLFCGNCAYVCPAKRPMMELLQDAAKHLDSSVDT